ncbi:MAG: DUF6675 family protein [Dongiaceae bacterium]
MRALPAMMALAALLAVWCAAAGAAPPPLPPCGAPPAPAYGPLGAAPAVALWHRAELAGWQPPACLGWPGTPPELLVAVAGRFRDAGGLPDLVGRFAAQSRWRGLRYWSDTEQRWETLITDAAALAGQDAARHRGDFSAAELLSGEPLYVAQSDNRSSGAVVYRLQLRAATADRLVMATENVSSVWLVLLPLFSAGDLASVYFLDRLGPGLWGYYGLSAVRGGLLGPGGHEASYVNRALAIYHLISGTPAGPGP